MLLYIIYYVYSNKSRKAIKSNVKMFKDQQKLSGQYV